MTQTAIIWPVIAQVLLVTIVYGVMGKRRFGAVRQGTARARDFLIPSVEPEASATVARNLTNQFELPVLFYTVCTLLAVTDGVSILTVSAAWLFVLSRYGHAFVHMTSNRLMLRHRLFVAGFFINALLWLLLALHIL
ncbi:hypothetical protein C8J36_103281 [Rhizobium sp. PP-F2F-G48]|uniref:MAPEG family protein n=1 Tax=Rhizobium sp. PP-F2F-G48 TaxID=2135651 RepID=UPI001049448B|nr:MAPEG family protein [Rhizobium sp. PP-F2F-G48]TCM55915.1 hypothetical protein C8J36_103281 [Rhizobium sp. PP-F2F-G48]